MVVMCLTVETDGDIVPVRGAVQISMPIDRDERLTPNEARRLACEIIEAAGRAEERAIKANRERRWGARLARK